MKDEQQLVGIVCSCLRQRLGAWELGSVHCHSGLAAKSILHIPDSARVGGRSSALLDQGSSPQINQISFQLSCPSSFSAFHPFPGAEAFHAFSEINNPTGIMNKCLYIYAEHPKFLPFLAVPGDGELSLSSGCCQHPLCC